jgi:predicted metalloprotease with PDZ domain
MSVRISVLPQSPARALVEGKCAPTSVWSFRDSYAGVLGLGVRVTGMQLFDASGAEIQIRKIAPGQFEAAKPASRFRYEVNLDPPARASDSAFVSWLNSERGLLMLADLLPLSNTSQARSAQSVLTRDQSNRDHNIGQATVRLSLPEGWTVYANGRESGQNEFSIQNVGRAVFAVGKHLRVSRTTVSKTALNLVMDGEWAFTDSDALEMATKVLRSHLDVFGAGPGKQVSLILFPFPQTVAADKWSAETRGSTVTLLMGRFPSKTAALAQLSVPLTHELFHLWVPNGLALDGDYDWFYEGFTVYQAARTAVRLELLTFQEFLNAIARAFDAYANGADRDRWSLIEASQRRWTTGGSVVYQKSMLVAFLFDLKLLSQSRGKRSLDDVYREVFRRYRLVEPPSVPITADAGQNADGNQAVVTVLEGTPGMQGFPESFIRRAAAIDLSSELATFGLRVERLGLRTRISASETLTRRQRDLLRELGYNDYARPPIPRKH